MHAPSATAPVILHAVTSWDTDFLYELASDPTIRAQSLDPTPPSPDEHQAWVRAFLADRERFGWIVLYHHERAAFVRLDHLSPLGAKIHVAVHKDYRGKGIGTAAVYHATLYATNREWTVLASVKPENWASRNMFTACGYVEVGPGRDGEEEVIVYAKG